MNTPMTIDGYIGSFPPQVQSKLLRLKALVLEIAPKAEETVSYGIPTFKLGKNLVHFAAFKSHIGFYPTPSGIIKFKNELAKYITSKGAIQFPLDQPLPINLIKRIVTFRVKEIKGEMNGSKK